MPTYTIQGPSGKTYTIEGPAGASADQLGQFILSQSQDEQKALSLSQTRARIDTDPISQGAKNFANEGGFFDRFNAGAGKAMTDLARGAGQKLGLVNVADIAESRRLDSPLMRTGAGVAGNIGANVAMLAPSALIPGAATIPGAAALGGTIGMLQPATSAGELALNTGLGAAASAGGQWLAGKAGNVLTQQAEASKNALAGNAQKVASAKNASASGYVIPPADLPNAGKLTEAVSGLSGKIKTAQVASERNQEVTNRLARSALGIADDVPLNTNTLQAVRSQAGAAYDAIKNTGTVVADKEYKNALNNIASKYAGASKDFPGAVKNEVGDLVNALNQPQFSAAGAVDMTKVLRETADAAFRKGDTGLGKAAKAASDALESALERHLASQGEAPMLGAFRAARETIAKTYTVQRGLNDQTGNVSAQALAALLKKGKPMSGDLKTVAEFGQAFPKASQALSEAPKALSPLDFATAFGASIASGGNPLSAIGLAARPAARSALLSGPVQSAALNRAGQPQTPNALLSLLADNPLLAPAGMSVSPIRAQIGQ